MVQRDHLDALALSQLDVDVEIIPVLDVFGRVFDDGPGSLTAVIVEQIRWLEDLGRIDPEVGIAEGCHTVSNRHRGRVIVPREHRGRVRE